MLTVDILRADQALGGLSDDQLNAIATLSKNDEETVIGAKIGTLHGQYDTDILEVSGIEKNNGEKSYDYAKRVISSLKESTEGIDALNTKIETQKTTISDLEKKLKEGSGDETLKKQLSDTENKLSELQGLYDKDKGNWENKEKEHAQAIRDMQTDNLFSSLSFKFKSDFPESVTNVLTSNAKATLLSKYTIDNVDNGKGGKVAVFRDDKGVIQNNPANKLNPYTVKELMEIELKDVLDAGRQQQGGGGSGGPGGSGATLVDLSSAKTQVEADKVIVQHLLKSGFVRGTQEFTEEQAKIRKENNIHKLDIR